MSNNLPWNEISGTFATLSAVSALLSRLFASPPDEELFNSLRDIDSEESLLLNEEDANWKEGLALLAGFCKGDDEAQRIIDVKGDHSGLFVGPGHVQAPPWGSVHMDLGFLQGPSTHKVLHAYRAAGLEPPNYGQEPPDHIAIELDFIAELDKRISEGAARSDIPAISQDLTHLRGFLTSFVEPWMEKFLTLIDQHAETDFYRGLAKTTRAAIKMQSEYTAILEEKLRAQSADGS